MPQLSRFLFWKFFLGLTLIGLALLTPLLFTAESLGVYRALEQGLATSSQIKLMTAPFCLFIKNILYCIPLYLGAFFLSASFSFDWRGRRLTLLNLMTVILVIVFIYYLNDQFYGITYAAGVPLFVIPVLQILLWALDYPYVNALHKAPVVLTTLAGFQFIDLMPALEHLPFGRDAAAIYMKSVLVGEGLRNTLNIVMLACAFVCFVTSGLLLLIIHHENRLIQINQLKAANAEILLTARMQELENRSTQELRNLVHDLKTPLTSIQTLTYVVRLHNQDEGHQQCLPYLDRIEGAVDHMSSMISEILYEDHRNAITTDRLLNMVLAQLSATPYADAIQSDNQIPQATVEVNSIRMARALINLTDNASHAKGTDPLSIRLTATEQREDGQPWVAITVADNGVGIPPHLLNDIWQRGLSTQNSSGLGLSFVQETVEGCGGHIHIESHPQKGTEITILLPQGVTDHE